MCRPSTLCVCTDVPGTQQPLQRASLPLGSGTAGEAPGSREGGVDVPGVLAPERCSLPKNIPTFPFLGRNIMSTGSSPAR